MIKYVIFDMDGVLFDTGRLYKEAWYKVAQRWQISSISPEEYDFAILGRSAVYAQQVLRGKHGKGFFAERYLSEQNELVDSLIKRKIPLKEGCAELLKFLHENKIKTALATSANYERSARYLKRSGLYDLIDVIVTSDTVAMGRPAPDILLRVCNLLGADPSECSAVEASNSGIIAASRAKMKPLMVIDMYTPDEETKKLCCGVCDTLFDVIEFIKKENGIG